MKLRLLRKRVEKVFCGLPPVKRFITTQFHRIFYYSRETWQQTSWLGTPLLKSPLDLWVVQEIIHEVRPDVIIETGTYRGGSAFFYATILDALGHGKVITIDPNEYLPRPAHPRITYLRASSVAEEATRAIRNSVGPGDERVIVILDADHAAAHVLAELRTYASFVSLGSYLIVEDTNVNGHPVMPHHGPGPMEAVRSFLAENDSFAADRSREKYGFSFNAGGFLKRIR